MTQKTTYKRARSKFDMAEMTARIKKRFRKKYKKTVTKNKIREIWKDWVEIMIIEPLVQKGKVQIDRGFSLEIVGKRLVDDKRKIALIQNMANGGGPTLKPIATRKEFTYRIVMKEDRFKEGILIFEPDKKIRQKVRHALENTNRYYRIENVNK